MMKLRTPADSSYAAHCYDREFGTSHTGTIMLLETIALREAVPCPERHLGRRSGLVANGGKADVRTRARNDTNDPWRIWRSLI